MKRTLFVVEGQTEQIFVLKFIEKLVALTAVHLKLEKLHADEIFEVSVRGPIIEDATHLLHILNVENDEKVNSYISDNIAAIKKKGFGAVYGLRDRYSGSTTISTVNPTKIDAWAGDLGQTHEIKVEVTIAIEEIEAWFLSVPNFFLAYSELLTSEKIKSITGLDLITLNTESLQHPAQVIDDVLKAVGKKYRKRLDDSHKIADAIDYDALYLEKSTEYFMLNRFVSQLSDALS